MSENPNLAILAAIARQSPTVTPQHRRWVAVQALYWAGLVDLIPTGEDVARVEITHAGRRALDARVDAGA